MTTALRLEYADELRARRLARLKTRLADHGASLDQGVLTLERSWDRPRVQWHTIEDNPAPGRLTIQHRLGRREWHTLNVQDLLSHLSRDTYVAWWLRDATSAVIDMAARTKLRGNAPTDLPVRGGK